jgi:hypothetical protein
MYNSYLKQKAKASNEPSFSLRDFAELKGVSTPCLKGFVVNSDLKPAFNRRNVDYYHAKDLSRWFENNKNKLTKG